MLLWDQICPIFLVIWNKSWGRERSKQKLAWGADLNHPPHHQVPVSVSDCLLSALDRAVNSMHGRWHAVYILRTLVGVLPNLFYVMARIENDNIYQPGVSAASASWGIQKVEGKQHPTCDVFAAPPCTVRYITVCTLCTRLSPDLPSLLIQGLTNFIFSWTVWAC